MNPFQEKVSKGNAPEEQDNGDKIILSNRTDTAAEERQSIQEVS